VHRLDYETSGVVLIAKSLKVYQLLQKQFTSRTIKKTYVAILQNSISHDTGTVRLPLRADIINRPRQLVCFDQGKQATTEYQQLNSDKNGVRVQFHPITGRTHQLRVHAAHKLGLNSPILGDSYIWKKRGAPISSCPGNCFSTSRFWQEHHCYFSCTLLMIDRLYPVTIIFN
jgi:tRNA pseudouridine32 synthase/23S rRNA pseudouridine746 synthase